MKISIEKSIDDKIKELVPIRDSGITQWTSIEDILHIHSLGNTCTMYELSFNSSEINTKYLKYFTKEEFAYILWSSDTRSIITNVPSNCIEDKYLKSLGYEPVSSYKGHTGMINTYIFVNPVYKPRVRKVTTKK